MLFLKLSTQVFVLFFYFYEVIPAPSVGLQLSAWRGRAAHCSNGAGQVPWGLWGLLYSSSYFIFIL